MGARNSAYPWGKNNDIDSIPALNRDAATQEMSLDPMDALRTWISLGSF